MITLEHIQTLQPYRFDSSSPSKLQKHSNKKGDTESTSIPLSTPLNLKSKVRAISYNSQNDILAINIASYRKTIFIYHVESGELVDKFNTKHNNFLEKKSSGNGKEEEDETQKQKQHSKANKNNSLKHHFMVTCMQFCPDATPSSPPKLAISQSDNIVHIYKWSFHNNSASTYDDKTIIWKKDGIIKKKSICNKFMEDHPITNLIWPPMSNSPSQHQQQHHRSNNKGDEILLYNVLSTIKLGHLKTNKSHFIWEHDENCPIKAMTIDMSYSSSNKKYMCIYSLHSDGSIYKIQIHTSSFDYIKRLIKRRKNFVSVNKIISSPSISINKLKQPLLSSSTTMTTLTVYGETLCVAGLNQKVILYDSDDGKEIQEFDFSRSNTLPFCKEFTVSSFHPNDGGNTLILGNFDSFYLFTKNEFSKNNKSNKWKLQKIHHCENMSSVTCISWKKSTSASLPSVALGSAIGTCDIYDLYQHRTILKNAFQLTHISDYQVLLKTIAHPNSPTAPIKLMIQSTRNNIMRQKNKILQIKPHKDYDTKKYRYIVVHTTNSLLIYDLSVKSEKDGYSQTQCSEIDWISSSSDGKEEEKFLFDCSPLHCIICKKGELFVVEYGKNEITTSIQTTYASPHLLSIQSNRIAFLLQSSSSSSSQHSSIIICVKDMISQKVFSLEHEYPIDFLELNDYGTCLLFRDTGASRANSNIRRGENHHQQQYSLYLWNFMNNHNTMNVNSPAKTQNYLATTTKKLLLSKKCQYCQWVPNSNVIIAQDDLNRMYIWYDIRQKPITKQVSGEIEGIERLKKTHVLVTDQVSREIVSYELSEQMIEFGFIMESLLVSSESDHNHHRYNQLSKAIQLLEKSTACQESASSGDHQSFSTNSWKQIMNLVMTSICTQSERNTYNAYNNETLLHKYIGLGEQCAAALGDVGKAKYFRSMKENKDGNIKEKVQVHASILILENKIPKALNLLDGDIETLADLKLFPEAIQLLKEQQQEQISSFHTNTENLMEQIQSQYMEWLEKTNQLCQIANQKLFSIEREEEKESYDEDSNKSKDNDIILIEAIKLYMNSGMSGKAADVLLKNEISSDDLPSHLIINLVSSLERLDNNEKIGELYEKILGHPQKSIEAYLKAYNFEKAIDMARRFTPSRVVSLEEQWGDYLLFIKTSRETSFSAEEAMEHYVNAHSYIKAAYAATIAQKWDVAMDFLSQVSDEDIEESKDDTNIPTKRAIRFLYEKLANHFIHINQLEEAEKYLIKARKYIQVFEMYVEKAFGSNDDDGEEKEEANDVEQKLYAFAMKYIAQEKYTSILMKKAQEMEIQYAKLEIAESIYLSPLLVAPQKAIKMYKLHKNYERMYKICQEYCSQTEIEREGIFFEEQGLWKQAEMFYLSSTSGFSSGVNKAIKMYRDKNMWKDAIRVSKYHANAKRYDEYSCSQLAYSYIVQMHTDDNNDQSNSLFEESLQFLKDEKLIIPTIQFASQKKNFELAFQLAYHHHVDRSHNKNILLDDIHYKCAIHLEDNERFLEAEEHFVKAHKLEEALEMYIHQRFWKDAMRIASTNLKYVNEVYLAQAKVALEEDHDFGVAEQFFIKGNQPDLAMNMYLKHDFVGDARRIAEAYNLSHPRLDSVDDGYHANSHIENDNSKKQLKAKAKTDEEITNESHLIFSMNEINSSTSLLDQIHVQTDSNNDDEKSDTIGDTLKTFAKNGDWNKLFELLDLKKSNLEHPSEETLELSKYYASLRLEEILKSCKLEEVKQNTNILSDLCREAIYIFTKNHLVLSIEKHFDLYKDFVKTVLGRNDESETEVFIKSVIHPLRTILYEKRHETTTNTTTFKEFNDLFHAVHYTSIYHKCKQQKQKQDDNPTSSVSKLTMLALKCSLTLLQYAGRFIPSDKAFYMAGYLCKEVAIAREEEQEKGEQRSLKNDYMNLAFKLCNHCVDIIEAIDEMDEENEDEASKEEREYGQTPHDQTSIPFLAFSPEHENNSIISSRSIIPSSHYITQEENREELRDWILSICMIDSQIDTKSFSSFSGEVERGSIYQGLLSRNEGERCKITGFPIFDDGDGGDKMKLNINGDEEEVAYVNRFDWRVWIDQVMSVCPWTEKKHTGEL